MEGMEHIIATYVDMVHIFLRFRLFMLVTTYAYLRQRRRGLPRNSGCYDLKLRVPRQLEKMQYMLECGDVSLINDIRINRDCFNQLCYLLENVGGLRATRHVTVAEQVAILLTVLSHHTKNRMVSKRFNRSGYTISKYFNIVLNTVLKLHNILFITPEPVPDDCTDSRWKYFKGCLGALDGTYIPVQVDSPDIPRYRNRKGNISVNVLAVCDQNMNYIYVLSGWEGSAADSRVLRDAISRTHGLKIPNGNYYLVDGGYTNGSGFLSPYKNVRYHLREWDTAQNAPQNYKEYFNLKHAKARNVIERSFGILKARWSILRSNSFYPIKTQNSIILGCCLLHNFIRTTMNADPFEDDESEPDGDNDNNGPLDFIDVVEPSQAWTNMRDNLAQEMFAAYV